MKSVFSGIDFGTSNSTVGVSDSVGVRLLPLEGAHKTLPSAIFLGFDEDRFLFGRSAINAYVDGEDGRLMRALKSVLGTSLINEKTRVRAKSLTFIEVLGRFFWFLKKQLEEEIRRPVDQVVLGRPVRFVVDEQADNSAQQTLQSIARDQGFRHVAFQYEPIAAALDYEQRVAREELVLVVDLGGGTSDFSIVRVSPERSRSTDRQSDILANAGIRIGGTDFDRLLSVARVMPELGLGSLTADRKRNLPQHYFHDLATWHRINSLYSKKVMSDLRQIRFEAERPDLVERLIRVVDDRSGHSLALAVEQAKIDLTVEMRTELELASFTGGGNIEVTRVEFNGIVDETVDRVVGTISNLVRAAGLGSDRIDTVFMTGGSSSVPVLREKIIRLFPRAQLVDGDLLGSVGTGLALDARRKFA